MRSLATNAPKTEDPLPVSSLSPPANKWTSAVSSPSSAKKWTSAVSSGSSPTYSYQNRFQAYADHASKVSSQDRVSAKPIFSNVTSSRPPVEDSQPEPSNVGLQTGDASPSTDQVQNTISEPSPSADKQIDDNVPVTPRTSLDESISESLKDSIGQQATASQAGQTSPQPRSSTSSSRRGLVGKSRTKSRSDNILSLYLKQQGQWRAKTSGSRVNSFTEGSTKPQPTTPFRESTRRQASYTQRDASPRSSAPFGRNQMYSTGGRPQEQQNISSGQRGWSSSRYSGSGGRQENVAERGTRASQQPGSASPEKLNQIRTSGAIRPLQPWSRRRGPSWRNATQPISYSGPSAPMRPNPISLNTKISKYTPGSSAQGGSTLGSQGGARANTRSEGLGTGMPKRASSFGSTRSVGRLESRLNILTNNESGSPSKDAVSESSKSAGKAHDGNADSASGSSRKVAGPSRAQPFSRMMTPQEFGASLMDTIMEGVSAFTGTTTIPSGTPGSNASRDLVEMVRSGRVNRLAMPQLRRYLRINNLKATGRRDELVDRLTRFVEST